MRQVGCYPVPGEIPGGFTFFRFSLANKCAILRRTEAKKNNTPSRGPGSGMMTGIRLRLP